MLVGAEVLQEKVQARIWGLYIMVVMVMLLFKLIIGTVVFVQF